ncbi:MAG TPA: methylated-DNA--[protein]-cysteine S-methyltransferase [Ktedonobacterales bacterium]
MSADERNGQYAGGLRAARALVRDLRALGTLPAPEGLAARSLARAGATDEYFVVESALGPVYVGRGARGVAAVMRAESDAAFIAEYLRRHARRVVRGEAPAELAAAVREGRGARIDFDLSDLTEFERAVLLKALEIPRGQVRPYGWIAREIGHPRAVRAVGTALAHNPVPLLIPCHRVVRSDGHLGQYSLGGNDAKRTVLAAEGVVPDKLEALARRGVRYLGSDTTHIFCFPTCRHARRTTPAHLIEWSSEAEARAAGYRPCKVCRPA